MGTFIFELNKYLDPEERMFKLSNVEIDNDVVNITLLVPSEKYDKYLVKNDGYDPPLRSKLNSIISSLLPEDMILKLNFKKTETSETQIKKSVCDFLAEDSKILVSKISFNDISVKINKGEYIEVIISTSKQVYEFCKSSAFVENLQKYLDARFIESFEVALSIDPYKDSSASIATISTAPQRIMNYQMKEILLGNITHRAKYIKDVLAAQNKFERVCVTGKITSLQEKDIEKLQKKCFSFVLDDTTGSTLKVSLFTNVQQVIDVMMRLKVDDKVAVEGSIEYSKFDSKYVMYLKAIALIDIDFEKALSDIKYLPVPDSYTTVSPQPYKESSFESISMFETNQNRVIPQVLLDHDFVVFDTETTGINTDIDKVIELAGVKISKGNIVETFTTFINPQEKLTEKIKELTNISQDMVDNAPLFKKVIGDFYKFCYNCCLVAHNAPFDMGMIVGRARDCGYNFDNKVYDTLALSREVFPQFKKFKLEYLCDQLDISLEGAHRAVNDAMATAKLFMIIAKKI